MTQQDKLKALIERAIERGYSKIGEVVRFEEGILTVRENVTDARVYLLDAYRLIFNHDFAKALFGDEKIEVYGGIFYKHESKPSYLQTHQIDVYLHHLQQAAILPTLEEQVDYMYKKVFGS